MKYATEDGPRRMEPVAKTSRRRCRCGCEKRATHHGTNNGIALLTGCELYIRRWVRDGRHTRKVRSAQPGRRNP